MAEISKINVNGTLYDIKDAVARERLFNTGSWIISTTAANTPQGVVWHSGSTAITGTLTAANADKKALYLVRSETQVGTNDVYDEYAAISNGSTGYQWEKLGDTQMSGSLTASSSPAVTSLQSGTHTHDVTVTTKYIKGTATNGSVTASGEHTHSLSGSVSLASASSTSTGAITFLSSLNGTKTFANKDHSHGLTGSTASAGSHAHTIEGSVTLASTATSGGITFVSEVSAAAQGHTHSITGGSTTKLSITRSTNVAVGADGTGSVTVTGSSSAITAVGTPSITAVASRTSATVATGAVDAGGSDIVTSVTQPTYQKTTFGNNATAQTSNYVQSLSTATAAKKAVVTGLNGNTGLLTGATLASSSTQPTTTGASARTASVDTANETLYIYSVALASTTGSVTATTASYGADGAVITSVTPTSKAFGYADNSVGNWNVSTGSLTTTTVYSANAPTSISGTMANTASKTFITAINSGTYLTGVKVTTQPVFDLTAGTTGQTVVVAEGSVAATSTAAATGTTKHLTVSHNITTASSGDHTHASGSLTVAANTASSSVSASTRYLTISNTLAVSASGSHTHEFTQPTITLSSGTSSDLAVGAPGTYTTGNNTGTVITGVGASKDFIYEVMFS